MSIIMGRTMATKDHDVERLTREQVDLIEKFEADYNAVDHHLRRELGLDKLESFTRVINLYSRKHMNWRDADLLRMVAELRNAIVHGKTEPYRYIAVPTQTISRALNQCRSRLSNPLLVVPKFQRPVQQVSTTDTLDHVLRLVAARDYSQFPAYKGGHFEGLLTENGITRWMAINVDQEIFGLKDILISDVLKREDTRPNFAFVARNTRVDDLVATFASEPMLEAALITQSGKAAEALLGIVTRWDIVHIS
jgi:predicted transcriptional regulator